MDMTTSHFGLTHILGKLTHILNSSASCIDLIFTSQPNLVMYSGIDSSLHPNCHHQIAFAKFYLKIIHLHMKD